MNIYVGNIPYETTEAELQEQFSAHGSVSNVNIIKDRDTNRSKGFGFVIMDNDEEAEKAISEMNGSEIHGRNIRVNKARPKKG
ncbi:MAG TPA: RNA-binding protein [Spirochaetota bacterium]|nr:RNA-binding protein [Spirochaetota bacterium]